MEDTCWLPVVEGEHRIPPPPSQEEFASLRGWPRRGSRSPPAIHGAGRKGWQWGGGAGQGGDFSNEESSPSAVRKGVCLKSEFCWESCLPLLCISPQAVAQRPRTGSARPLLPGWPCASLTPAPSCVCLSSSLTDFWFIFFYLFIPRVSPAGPFRVYKQLSAISSIGLRALLSS